jgi:hypothetical protein
MSALMPIAANHALNKCRLRIHRAVDVNDYPTINAASAAIRDIIATDVWMEWEKDSGAKWNKDSARAQWGELKSSWLSGYPFDSEYEIAFIKRHKDSPEEVFAPILGRSRAPKSWVSDYLAACPASQGRPAGLTGKRRPRSVVNNHAPAVPAQGGGTLTSGNAEGKRGFGLGMRRHSSASIPTVTWWPPGSGGTSGSHLSA